MRIWSTLPGLKSPPTYVFNSLRRFLTDISYSHSSAPRSSWSIQTPDLCIPTHISCVAWSTSFRSHGRSSAQDSGLSSGIMGRNAPISVAASTKGTVIRAFTTVSMMLYRRSSVSSWLPVDIFVPFSVVSHRSTSVSMEPMVFNPFGRSGDRNLAWNSVSTNGAGVTPSCVSTTMRS